METWAWILAYILGFTLLQLYLYRYFVKSSSTEGAPPESPADGTPSPSDGAGAPIDPPEGESEADLVQCSECGTYNENDPMYTFCKDCGERLQ